MGNAGSGCSPSVRSRRRGAPVESTQGERTTWEPNPRWHRALGSKPASISQTHGGRVGLENFGNTCFMNAGLQCLSHIEPVSAYFLTGKYQEELNTKNKLGSGGALAQAFAKLQEELWTQDIQTQAPRELHKTLVTFAPHLLEGYEQQDAQEFLAFLLDGLHEDLNLNDTRPPPPEQLSKEDEEEENIRELDRHLAIEEEFGEEYLAALAWMHHLALDKSFFVDLFQGQLRSCVTCLTCGCESKTYDPYLYMSLPVNDDMRTLEDALRLFLAEETLSGNEQWKCPRCRSYVDATKKIGIWKLPQVLVVHLKRFEFNTRTYRFRKIQADLESPLTVDLSQFVASEQLQPQIYDIIGVANHSGPFGCGHYTATCRHPVDGRYYHFNDERVEEVQNSKVLSKRAYVLFLMRRASEDDGVGDGLQRQSVSHPEVWPHSLSRKNSLIVPEVKRYMKSRGFTGRLFSKMSVQSSADI